MKRQPKSAVRRNIERRALRNFAAGTLACAMVAAAMLLHAWVRTRVTERGYALSRLSAEYRDLMREHEELARTRLNMGPPPVDRVVVLVGGAVRASVLTASR